MSEGDNADLIRRARKEPQAFAQLYLLYYDQVFHYCVRRLFDRHAAEDVTSTVFFKVMRKLNSFDGQAMHFRSWLLRVATNAVNDYLRDARRKADGMRSAARDARIESTFLVPADDDLARRKALLKQSLLELKPKDQTVITLRFFENMKVTEIAACLGEKPSTISTGLARAVAKLRRKLSAAENHRGQEP